MVVVTVRRVDGEGYVVCVCLLSASTLLLLLPPRSNRPQVSSLLSMSGSITSALSSSLVLDKSRTVHFSPDRTLYGVAGAREVCDAIASKSTVTTLGLPHHKLGDEGASELFRWLCSGNGRNYRLQISELDISDNDIGDKGLAAIAEYLLRNRRLKVLTLSRNNFQWDDSVLSSFADAVNSSRLQDLALNTVPHGDVFVPRLLSLLNTPYLKAIRISMTGLTERSTSALTQFIVSPRCRLYRLSLSGNSIGQSGVNAVLEAMHHNYSLRIVELFANADEIDYASKKMIETRNNSLINCVANEARALLRASRVVLLQRTENSPGTQSPPTPETRHIELPLEIKQHILTFLAPHLSTAQCLRIFDYASSPATLPLLSTSSSHSCLPDPSAVPFGLSAAPPRRPCEGGVCMGAGNSLSCRREVLRADWLLKVCCDAPDPKVAALMLTGSN